MKLQGADGKVREVYEYNMAGQMEKNRKSVHRRKMKLLDNQTGNWIQCDMEWDKEVIKKLYIEHNMKYERLKLQGVEIEKVKDRVNSQAQQSVEKKWRNGSKQVGTDEKKMSFVKKSTGVQGSGDTILWFRGNGTEEKTGDRVGGSRD